MLCVKLWFVLFGSCAVFSCMKIPYFIHYSIASHLDIGQLRDMITETTTHSLVSTFLWT